jgi:hypothetical protein
MNRGTVSAGMSSPLNAEDAERGAERAEKNLLGFGWGGGILVCFRPPHVPDAAMPIFSSADDVPGRIPEIRESCRDCAGAMAAGGGNHLKQLLVGIALASWV